MRSLFNVLGLTRGHLIHFWQCYHPEVKRDRSLFHKYIWLQCICHLRPGVKIWVQIAAVWLCPSSFLLHFLSSRQIPYVQEPSQCLLCSILCGTQELLINGEKLQRAFIFIKSLIFITWRTMSCIIKSRKLDGQLSPFFKNVLCCFLVCKHNHKISNL